MGDDFLSLFFLSFFFFEQEVQGVQQRANEALVAASQAEHNYRQLENECRELLTQLRLSKDRSYSSTTVPDGGACIGAGLDSPCISPMTPMTPNPPGLLVSKIMQSAPVLAAQSLTSHFHSEPLFTGQSTKPFTVTELSVPPTFDFAAILPKTNGGPATVAEQPKIKSSLRTENKNGSKSISFGPTTTFSTSPQIHPLIPDFNVAVATSTLKKISTPTITSSSPLTANGDQNESKSCDNH